MTFQRFDSRFQAGELLSEVIKTKKNTLFQSIKENREAYFCFAIPNGGVPVAEGFCQVFNIKYDIIIVRKIKIPWNTEAGFGSITTDGTVLINEPLYQQLNLSEKQLEKAIHTTKQEIQERLKLYDKLADLGEDYTNKIQGKEIFMIDDGLASGFTMKAAIKMIQKYNPQKIYLAVPTAPLHTVKKFKDDADNIFCPNIRDTWHFAVASAYKHWYDIPETEVLEIIKKSEYYMK